MRADLQIDDDVYEEAKRLAASKNQSIGKVLSHLARKGLRVDFQKQESGFPQFSVPEGTPKITLEMVKAAESDS
jgi:predicted CopG family antitoxin